MLQGLLKKPNETSILSGLLAKPNENDSVQKRVESVEMQAKADTASIAALSGEVILLKDQVEKIKAQRSKWQSGGVN